MQISYFKVNRGCSLLMAMLIAGGFTVGDFATASDVLAASGGSGPAKIQKPRKKRKARKPRTRRSGGLCGKKGKVRSFAYSGGSCRARYKSYVAACGHSAYVQTSASTYAQAIVCSISLNNRSARAAERAALASCKRGLGRFKGRRIQPDCRVFASK